MVRVLEVKKTLKDTPLIENIYEINRITQQIIKQTEFITELAVDDYNYLNIVLERTKQNLLKAYLLIKITNKYS